MIMNPVPWPNGARCAVTFTWDMDADSILHLAHPNDSDTRISTASMLRYGPLIAVERILGVLDELGVKHSFFVPGWCAEQYPEAVKMMIAEGHEVAHHGYLHEYPNEMTRDKERYWTKRGIDALASITGKRPVGYRAPWYKFSKYSLEILIEEGFTWDCSLMGADVPHLIKCDKGDLIELPGNIQLDDWPQFVHNADLDYMMPIQSPQRAKEVYMAEFEAMWEYGGLWVPVWHPFLSGRLARWRQTHRMIEKMMERGQVWFAPLRDIARHVQRCTDDGTWQPRVERYGHQPGLPAVPVFKG